MSAACACGCGETVPNDGMKTSACAARAVEEWVRDREARLQAPKAKALTKKQAERIEQQQNAHRRWYGLAGERPPDDAA